MNDCPNCEYHIKRAQLWRDEAYKQAGHPLPEREPVACLPPTPISENALYATSPQRTWVGLTDEEQSFVYDQVKQIVDSKPFWVKFADAIEAKLKEKNT
jgi:hypothetical protein